MLSIVSVKLLDVRIIRRHLLYLYNLATGLLKNKSKTKIHDLMKLCVRLMLQVTDFGVSSKRVQTNLRSKDVEGWPELKEIPFPFTNKHLNTG